jgi:hypothetical protein
LDKEAEEDFWKTSTQRKASAMARLNVHGNHQALMGNQYGVNDVDFATRFGIKSPVKAEPAVPNTNARVEAARKI